MIFNTWAYYLFFLVPSAILFRLSPLRFRPWVIIVGGSAFFLYFSYTELGGRAVLELRRQSRWEIRWMPAGGSQMRTNLAMRCT